MEKSWKKNWIETKKNFTDWWNREGLVISMWGAPLAAKPHEPAIKPEPPSYHTEEYYSDPILRARVNHYLLSTQSFPADIMPIPNTYIGPGSLAMHLGSKPEFRKETVWFHPVMQNNTEPEKLPSLKFDPEEMWWKIQENTLRESVALGKGKYITACPDLVENIDILASLRGMTELFLDMIERPEWVSQKLREINLAYFEIYDRIYDIIKLGDESSAYEAYRIWGPGKTAKVQCDASTMFSPEMFEHFVVPAMTEQCEWLDYSMYHLDGSEEFVHLDALLSIESLDAIEWTPNANEPLGGDPKWYDLYERILDAGKSVQAYLIFPDEIVPLLDAVGGKGMYILGIFKSEDEVESVLKSVEQFR